MSSPATNDQPSKPRFRRWYAGAALLAVMPLSFFVWAAVEHVQDAADRSH